jgi:hypothetical protein
LIEDVVRNIKNEFRSSFIHSYPTLSGNPSFATDDGNLFVNGSEIQLFTNSFLNIKNKYKSKFSIAGSIFFDITFNDKGLFASGFGYENDDISLISTFEDQQAVEFNLVKFIPENAATVEHFGTTDFRKWYPKWVVIQKEGTIEVDQGKRFMSFISKELVQVTLQSVDNNHLNKLFIAELSDVAGMYNHLNKIAEQQIENSSDSLYVEQYAGKEIRLIDNNPILKKYFGETFDGFKSTYYLMHENYLVIANTAETLRTWLVQIENEFTWSKSVRMNSFFKNGLTEANYTYVTNLEYSWNLQDEKLNKNIKLWATANAEVLKEFSLVTFQLANLDNRYYTNLHINYAPLPKVVADNNVVDVNSLQLTNKIINKLKIVKNHTNGSWEILAQDSLNNLLLISEEGEVLWADSIGSKLKGEIFQIDYFKNSKLQYLVHSDSALFLIDRNGNSVENFPLKFRYRINQVYLVDYDRSKNYRILISDHFGNLRMYNKEGEILEGWNPNEFNASFSDNIFHIRVRGNDRILIPLSKGVVHLTNRRGEEVNGFPLDLGMPLTTKFFVRPGERFDDTEFITVSKDGLVARFSMEGKMHSRHQLVKESSQSTFELLRENQGKDYVFIRNDLNRLSVLSSEGGVLFEKDFSTSEDRSVQYYNFGSDRQLFVVRNNTSVYLYNQRGKLLTNIPLTSEFKVSVVYYGNENVCHLYLSRDNTIEIKKIYL